MQKIYTLIQQGLIAMVIAGASVGVVLAAPSFDITTLVSGFIRYTYQHGSCQGAHAGDYCYGYGWSGNLQEWGYGYGYSSKDFSGEAAATYATDYGFDGNDGAGTIESITATRTTAVIVYSTTYLAKVSIAIGKDNPVTEGNFIAADDNSEFTSGIQQSEFSNLDCGTVYYYGLVARDAAKNRWTKEGSFKTDLCGNSSGPSLSGKVSNFARGETSYHPLTLRIPAIFLSFGSNGTDVQDLQRLLNFFGTLLASHGAGAPGEETIYFRNKTLDALKRFQAAFHLTKVDGIYGPETQRAMYEQLVK